MVDKKHYNNLYLNLVYSCILKLSDMKGNGINFLPDAGGLNVLRHFICDMCKVDSNSYRSVYWQLFRCCLRDMLADPSHPVLATLFIIREGSRSTAPLESTPGYGRTACSRSTAVLLGSSCSGPAGQELWTVARVWPFPLGASQNSAGA